MVNGKPNVEDAFMTYLASQITSEQISEFYPCYSEIDSFFRKAGVLEEPLFETTDIKKIKKLRQAVERNQTFHNWHKKDLWKFVKAVRHYSDFLRVGYRPQSEQDKKPANKIENPKSSALAVPPFAQEISDPSEVQTIDFRGKNDVAYTKPIQFYCFGKVQSGFANWKGLYVAFVAALCADYPQKFQNRMVFSASRKRIDLSVIGEASMISPIPVPGTDYILETNYSTSHMITKMKYLLDLCGVGYENVVITYRKKNIMPRGSEHLDNFRRSEKKNDRESFRRWLESDIGLARPTANSYTHALLQCESFAQSHDYPLWQLYTDDLVSAKNVIELLRNDPAYDVENDRQHHRWSAALSRYEQFLGATPAAASAGTASTGGTGGSRLSACWTPKFGAQVSQILKNHYSYGFRMDSSIERVRFRNFAEQDQISIPETDDELDREIAAAGMQIDGKIYAFEEQVLDELQELVRQPLRDGAGVLFYEPFTEQNEEWLEEHCITSVEMVKTILPRLFPDFWFAPNFFASERKKSELSAVTEEIHRVGGTQCVLFFEDVCRQLLFVPSGKIAWCLSASDDFVWISEGKYFVMEYFAVSSRDVVAIREFVANECRENGFASMADLPYGSIPEENYELSPSALHTAVYLAVLQPQYKLNGKILTGEKSADVDLSVLLTQYCRERESCTLKEVMEQAQNLVGAHNRQICFTVLYDCKVRTDKAHFVPESQVRFDVDQIDRTLQGIVGNRFAPLRSVATFALFPPCGASWNHYLLESYCYRFSKIYSLRVMNFNNKNVGIIAAKSLHMSYVDMLCEAAADSQIELTPQAVGQYFVESGLMAKKKFPRLDEIAERADALRDGR